MGCTQSTVVPKQNEHMTIEKSPLGKNREAEPAPGKSKSAPPDVLPNTKLDLLRRPSLEPSKSDTQVLGKKNTKKKHRVSLEQVGRSGTTVKTIDSKDYQEFENDIEKQLEQSQEDLPPIAKRNPRKHGRRQSLKLPYSKDLSQKNSEQFDYLCVIGKGAFGRVVRVRNKQTKTLHAMKIVYKPFLNRLVPEIQRQVKVEREMLNLFDHPFIVRLIYEFETKEYVFLVMELLRGGTLYKHMKLMKRMPEDLVRIWAAEIILGLEHMHENHVVYRDLKPDNIMLDKNGHARIIDLGLAAKLEPGQKLQITIGAPGYKAPEMFKGGHDYSIDYWNLGVLLYKMLTTKHPMDRRFSDAGLDENTKQGFTVRFPRGLSSDCKDLLSNLLKHNPEERIGIRNGTKELKAHPFFKQLDWEIVKRKEVPIPDFENFNVRKIDENERARYSNARELMNEFKRQEQERRANAGKKARGLA